MTMPGIESIDLVPGHVVQTASVMIPQWEMVNNYEETLRLKDKAKTSLCLCATIDLGAHLTLDAVINSMVATTLIDSGATGMFMHPQFAQRCGAEI